MMSWDMTDQCRAKRLSYTRTSEPALASFNLFSAFEAAAGVLSGAYTIAEKARTASVVEITCDRRSEMLREDQLLAA